MGTLDAQGILRPDGTEQGAPGAAWLDAFMQSVSDTAADIRADIAALAAATVTTYTPVLSGAVVNSLGAGSYVGGHKARIGALMWSRIAIQFGSSGLNIGAGALRVSLPDRSAAGMPLGGGRLAGQYYYPPIGTLQASLYIPANSLVGHLIVPVDATSNAIGDLNMGAAAGAGTPQAPGKYGIDNNANLIFEGLYRVA